MNIAKQFQAILPFITLFQVFLRLLGHENLAKTTETYITAITSGISALPTDTSTVLRGTEQITDYGEQVLAQINAVKASGLDKSQKIAEATRLASTLSDRKIVFQPKKGEDFRVLNDYKARTLNLVGEISKG